MKNDLDWILTQARLADDQPLVDLGLSQGRIALIRPHTGAEIIPNATQTWDLAGRVVLPGLVDAHTHLDKTYSTIQNQSGTLLEAIQIWTQTKGDRSQVEVKAAARRALKTGITHGLTAMRSHVDTVDRPDLKTLEALLELRQEMSHLIDLQLVALGNPAGSLENQETMAQALHMGVDCVGAAPALSTDPPASIEAAFALAERFGKPIDLHIDETEDPHSLTLEYLAEQTIAHGMRGQVTAGHCCSLAFVDPATATRIINKVAQARLNIITLPSCNLVLMGRGIRPTPRGVTPVKALLAAGIKVSAASDNVQDSFNPFGSYDLLQIANLNAHVAHMSGQAEIKTCLDMVTTHPAQILGLPAAGLVVDAPADLVVLDTTSVLEAVASPPIRLATFKAGQRVVHTRVSQTWGDEYFDL